MSDTPQPIKFSKEFASEIDKYIEIYKKQGKKPTIAGFANLIETDEKSIWAWAEKKKKDEQGNITEELARPNFHAAVKKLEAIQNEPEEKKEEQLEESGLNVKQELFCRLITQNTEFFGNATLAYAEAYKFHLDELSNERQVDGKGKEVKGTSEFEKAYAVCGVNGSRLLKNARVQAFVRKCYNEFLRDDVVDGELIRVVLQDRDLSSKMAAIREYNKLKARVTEHIDHTTKGKKMPQPIYGSRSINK